MTTAKLTATLDCYDGIRIFAAHDPIGGHYVCDMIDAVGDLTATRRLASVRKG